MTRTILIVDGQLTTRRMLRFALEFEGYRVIEAADADDALVALHRDVSLMMVSVAGDGDRNWELIRWLRLQPEYATVPVLLLAGSRCGLSGELSSLGGCAWLQKPFSINDVHGKVETLIAVQATGQPQGADRCKERVSRPDSTRSTIR